MRTRRSRTTRSRIGRCGSSWTRSSPPAVSRTRRVWRRGARARRPSTSATRAEDVGWCVETFAIEACRNAASMSIPSSRRRDTRSRRWRRSARRERPGRGTRAPLRAAISAAVATWRFPDDRAGALAGNRALSRVDGDGRRAPSRRRRRLATRSGGPGATAAACQRAAEAPRQRRRPARLRRDVPEAIWRRPSARWRVARLVVRARGSSVCYLTLRDTLSAVTRLNLVGPLRVGALLRRCSGPSALARRLRGAGARLETRRRAARARRRRRRARAGASPLVDVVQGGHDALYPRLFSS